VTAGVRGGGGWRVAGRRVTGGGWRVAGARPFGGGWRVFGGGWRVAGGGWRDGALAAGGGCLGR
jgi:hypothetical protein